MKGVPHLWPIDQILTNEFRKILTETIGETFQATFKVISFLYLDNKVNLSDFTYCPTA